MGISAELICKRAGLCGSAEDLRTFVRFDDINVKDTEGQTALHLAVHLFNTKEGRDCVRNLLGAGADVDAKDNNCDTPLMLATQQRKGDCVEVLLSHGADVTKKNKSGRTALHWAARFGHVECVQMFIGAGADVNTKDNNGGTALIIAAQAGKGDCVELLLSHGANVDAKSYDGRTPLMFAARKGKGDCVEVLLSHGADVDAEDNGGDTALRCAALFGHVECVQMLIGAGADVNTKDDYGYTPLMLAAQEGKGDCVEVLLSHGADITKNTKNGKTALQIAVDNNHYQCAELILRYRNEKVSGPSMQVAVQNRTNEVPVVPAQLDDPRSQGLPVNDTAMANSFVPPCPALSSLQLTDSMTPTAPPLPTTPETAPHEISQRWTFDYSDVTIIKKIGGGSFGKVFHGTWQGVDVAIKEFALSAGGVSGSLETVSNPTLHPLSPSSLAKVKQECEFLASIRHPNIIYFLGVCLQPLCAMTELCEQGSLFDVLRKAKRDPTLARELTWSKRLQMACGPAAGMMHLHGRSPPILHRDIKSVNFLVAADDKVKVADFGLSQIIEEENSSSSAESSMGSINARWAAPEVLRGGECTMKSDVYSFGVVLWEIMTWELPGGHYVHPAQMAYAKRNGDPMPFPSS